MCETEPNSSGMSPEIRSARRLYNAASQSLDAVKAQARVFVEAARNHTNVPSFDLYVAAAALAHQLDEAVDEFDAYFLARLELDDPDGDGAEDEPLEGHDEH